ncbi:hypothetical protein QBC38DRAFT_485157 [Podospora fimiseda]|uniref:Uncharacterized protein n=1 Tax=Podospora fimiseda TaxID=252190 RepID=A0AAN7BK00_9PEZI|nr:hypothetical protein QBC38DRAFT_485157 [Podospora fimiseda]
MGGSAFSYLENPPFTPRMSPVIYKQVKTACHAALGELFVYVATPIEGPAKLDHGDIDIFVSQEKRLYFPKTKVDIIPKSHNDLLNEVKLLLNAEFCKIVGQSANLTIKWPSSTEVPKNEKGQEASIQVDVRICRDIDQLCWSLFKHAHGDIWNILGSTIRPFGLTVDEESLWLRIPEIENHDRPRSKIKLTSDPVEILHFFGMKVEGYWSQPFASVQDLFEYATTCRFFWVRPEPAPKLENYDDQAGVIGGEQGKKKLKANDRKRMAYRAVYRRWIEEYIPQLRAENKFSTPPANFSSGNNDTKQFRAIVRDEAFQTFLFVEKEYNDRLKEWRYQKDAEKIKRLIKEVIHATVPVPDEKTTEMTQQSRQTLIHKRSCLVSGMKKIILREKEDADAGFKAVFRPEFSDKDGGFDIEVVRAFLLNNQKQVGEIAWGLEVARYEQFKERKQLKRKAE